MTKTKPCIVKYNPHQDIPVIGGAKGEHELSRHDIFEDAVEAAYEAAKVWGATWVTNGRKTLHKVPDLRPAS